MGIAASAGKNCTCLLDAFKRLDKNGSGKLSKDELTSFMQGHDKETWTDDVCADLLKEADADENGLISTRDFINFLKDLELSAMFFKLGEQIVDEAPCEVFHCTLMDAANSIAKEGFRFPVKGVTDNCGWKLGYAVYFGTDAKYCLHEFLNTLEDKGKCPETVPATQLAMIKVTVKKGKSRKLGNYDELGKISGIPRKDLDALTEELDKESVAKHGYDTLTINDGTKNAEVAVYDKSSIISIEVSHASKYL